MISIGFASMFRPQAMCQNQVYYTKEVEKPAVLKPFVSITPQIDAMNSMRMGHTQQAIDYLLHPVFQFDDAGYAVGGSRVPTPYMPNSASLLLAVAMMAGGWDEAPGPHFPDGWDVKVEGFIPGI